MSSLSSLALFSGMTAADSAAIIAAGHRRMLPKGEPLFLHGAPLTTCYLLLDGAVRQCRQTPDGKEITLGLAGAGNLLAATHLFDAVDSYQWSAYAEKPSEVVAFPIPRFKQLLVAHPALALNILAALSQQAHLSAVDAEHRITLSAAQRLACSLLRICTLHRLNPQHFALPYSKSTLASTLGMEGETFSRSLKKLASLGVHVRGSQVEIRDPHALECYVCGHCSIADDCTTLASLHAGACSAKP